MIRSFEDCFDIANRGIPNLLKDSEEFMMLQRVLAFSMSRIYDLMDDLDNAYSIDFLSDEYLSKLADTMSIQYPIGASASRLRLLLKYYQKIMKNRGSIPSIKQMVRILESTESEIYSMTLEDYMSVEVEKVSDGFMLVKCDNITDFEFAKDMLRRVVHAGYKFILSNKNGPYVYRADWAIMKFKAMIDVFEYVYDGFDFSDNSEITEVEWAPLEELSGSTLNVRLTNVIYKSVAPIDVAHEYWGRTDNVLRVDGDDWKEPSAVDYTLFGEFEAGKEEPNKSVDFYGKIDKEFILIDEEGDDGN